VLLATVNMPAKDEPLPHCDFDRALGGEWNDHRAWARIDDRLDQSRALFETASARLPQNEEIPLMPPKDYLMLRSAACPEEPPQAASRRGRVSKHATIQMQPLLVLHARFLTSLTATATSGPTSF